MLEISVEGHCRPHMPEGNWRVLNSKDQPSELQEPPFTWISDRIHLLSLNDLNWNETGEGRRDPLIGSYRLVPVQVADYLFEHQDQIPTAWYGKDVLFWTIYKEEQCGEYYPHGQLFASALTWIGGRWTRLYVPILSPWTERDMLAVYG